VRAVLGFSTSKDEVLASQGVSDTWIVAGQIVTDEGTVRSRRTWLIGRKTLRRALILDFAPGARPFEVSLPAGLEFEGELAFYPTRLPVRALVKGRDASGCDAAE
jgi:hypothetical protein